MSNLEVWPKKSGKGQLQMFTWNVRGLGDYHKPESRIRVINEIFEQQKEWDVLMIQEHKLNRQKIEDARRFYMPQGETYWWDACEARDSVAITINKKSGIQVLEEFS